MSIETLIKAAAYLDRKDRGEHLYRHTLARVPLSRSSAIDRYTQRERMPPIAVQQQNKFRRLRVVRTTQQQSVVDQPTIL